MAEGVEENVEHRTLRLAPCHVIYKSRNSTTPIFYMRNECYIIQYSIVTERIMNTKLQ